MKNSVFPTLTLPDSRGRTVSLWDYRQHKPVVLVLAGEDLDVLQIFEDHYSRYSGLGTEVVVVTGSKPPEEYSFPVLLDESGDVSHRYVEQLPAILVLDRYGELREIFQGPWERAPDHAEIVELVIFTESECPECGISEWRQ